MPELPEVETVRGDLERTVVGKTVADVHLTWLRAIGDRSPEEFAAAVRGRRFVAVRRRGKYLGIELSSGQILVCHLKMTGRLLVAAPGAERPRWVHNWFDFTDGSHLWFQDARKFGRLWLVDDMAEAAGHLGPEPIDPAFSLEVLTAALARRSAPIKPLLLQQEVIAGVGNIYADESLWLAGIEPHRPANSLTDAERQRLWRALRQVLRRAVAHRGSSMDDFLDAFGQQGHYKQHLKAYGHKGEPCPRCGTPMAGEVLRQRSAVWCPTCQT